MGIDKKLLNEILNHININNIDISQKDIIILYDTLKAQQEQNDNILIKSISQDIYLYCSEILKGFGISENIENNKINQLFNLDDKCPYCEDFFIDGVCKNKHYIPLSDLVKNFLNIPTISKNQKIDLLDYVLENRPIFKDVVKDKNRKIMTGKFSVDWVMLGAMKNDLVKTDKEIF